jgi:hypothetical protein
MISEKIVTLIKENAGVLTDRVMKDLLTREETKGYRTLNKDILSERVFDVYSRLDSWLVGDKVKAQVRTHYIALGQQRFHENIPLRELVMALMLIKRHLWLYVEERHFFDSAYECYQALELNNRVVLFFDRAIYFSTMGYERELLKAVGKTQGGVFSRIFKKKQVSQDIERHPDHKDLQRGKIV